MTNAGKRSWPPPAASSCARASRPRPPGPSRRRPAYSNGVLTHYFADKDEILLSALRSSHRRITERLAEKLTGLTGLAALRELLLDNLPLEEERERETSLEIGFWARSLTSPALLEVQREEAGDLHLLVRSLLQSAADAGEIAGRGPRRHGGTPLGPGGRVEPAPAALPGPGVADRADHAGGAGPPPAALSGLTGCRFGLDPVRAGPGDVGLPARRTGPAGRVRARVDMSGRRP